MHKNSLNNLKNGRILKKNCRWCNEKRTIAQLKRHENVCYLNPEKLKKCPVCRSPIKDYKKRTTCSCSCSNTFFRSGENHPNWKQDTYRTTCFLYHKKECIICKEKRIVEVHHYDGNSKNNKKENFIPLCPTHHKYMHSGYKKEILNEVNEYIKKFISSNRG